MEALRMLGRLITAELELRDRTIRNTLLRISEVAASSYLSLVLLLHLLVAPRLPHSLPSSSPPFH